MDHDCDPGHASGGRRRFRIARRPLRTPKAAHGQRGFLFTRRTAVRICPELHRVSDSAHALRYRDGRRVGRGSFACHGERAAEVARHFVRHRAERIFHWLPAGGRSRAIRSAHVGLARHVLGRRRAGAAGACTSATECASRRHGNNAGPRPSVRSCAPLRVIGGFFFISSC